LAKNGNLDMLYGTPFLAGEVFLYTIPEGMQYDYLLEAGLFDSPLLCNGGKDATNKIIPIRWKTDWVEIKRTG